MSSAATGIVCENVSVAKLDWATDWHLNFLKPAALRRFMADLADIDADALALCGDISDGPRLQEHFSLLASSFDKPLFFVLGNHDRYHSSFAEAEKAVAEITGIHRHLYRLQGEKIFQLSTNTALVGVDGWADGLAGAGNHSSIRLNDAIMIRDLAVLPPSLQWLKMKELAEGFTQAAAIALDQALAGFEHVIFITHVPPFPEAAWHEGRMSEPEFLPHFSNPTLGTMLRAACARWPDKQLTVLCGHTHGEGVYQEGNLKVITGGAEYGAPAITDVLKIE